MCLEQKKSKNKQTPCFYSTGVWFLLFYRWTTEPAKEYFSVVSCPRAWHYPEAHTKPSLFSLVYMSARTRCVDASRNTLHLSSGKLALDVVGQ